MYKSNEPCGVSGKPEAPYVRHEGYGKACMKWQGNGEDIRLFRTDEDCKAPWSERTLEQLRAQRYEREVMRLGALETRPLSALDMRALTARIEACWQDIPRKPLRAQQAAVAQQAVLRTIERQADCLSAQEHALCERLFMAGGRAALADAQELDAARALSLRLLARVGMADGMPTVVLEADFARALEAAFSREEHARMRMRLFTCQATVCAALYLAGVLDDRAPQQLFTAQVLGLSEPDQDALELARHYLWASFDCMDYEDGVLLIHPAVANPQALTHKHGVRLEQFTTRELLGGMQGILPQEEPLEDALTRALSGALRPGVDVAESVRTLRLLCKQGAPVDALREVTDGLLMVRRTERMDAALLSMHAGAVRWNGAEEPAAALLQ